MSKATAQAPGRVNIIGEHIDYCGYSVLPCALKQCIEVTASFVPQSDGVVKLIVKNTDTSYSEAIIFAAHRRQQLESQQSLKLDWTDYVLCGYCAAVRVAESIEFGSDPISTIFAYSIQFLVTGRIPPGQGLSSSSALVVSSCLAVCELMGLHPSMQILATYCVEAERLVGTMGGGMDQTVSCLAEAGKALQIDCRGKLVATPIALPPNIAIVLASSMVTASKAVGAKKDFNTRVLECRFATFLLLSSVGTASVEELKGLKRLRDFEDYYYSSFRQRLQGHSRPREDSEGSSMITQELPIQRLQAAVAYAESTLHAHPYTLEEIEAAMAPYGLQPLDLFSSSASTSSSSSLPPTSSPASLVLAEVSEYKLRDRAIHVYGEAMRVLEFCDECRHCGKVQPNKFIGGVGGDGGAVPETGRAGGKITPSAEVAVEGAIDSIRLRRLGDLMVASHRSLQLLYECSCPELDELVQACLDAGALGARLTGAGWGGMVVCMVPLQQLPAEADGQMQRKDISVAYAAQGEQLIEPVSAVHQTAHAAAAAAAAAAASFCNRLRETYYTPERLRQYWFSRETESRSPSGADLSPESDSRGQALEPPREQWQQQQQLLEQLLEQLVFVTEPSAGARVVEMI